MAAHSGCTSGCRRIIELYRPYRSSLSVRAWTRVVRVCLTSWQNANSQTSKHARFEIQCHLPEVPVCKEEMNRRGGCGEWIGRDVCSDIVCMALLAASRISSKRNIIIGTVIRNESRTRKSRSNFIYAYYNFIHMEWIIEIYLNWFWGIYSRFPLKNITPFIYS